MTSYLTLEDLLSLIDDLGVGPVRDIGLLDASAHRPTSSAWGFEVYPTLHLKAAALLESIVRSHSLLDGNKCLGWLPVVVFYAINDVTLDAPDDDAYNLVISVASGAIEVGEIAASLEMWTVPSD